MFVAAMRSGFHHLDICNSCVVFCYLVMFFRSVCCALRSFLLLLLLQGGVALCCAMLRRVMLCCVTSCSYDVQFCTSGMVDRVFARIGASDNLVQYQSTFMSEMLETAHILTQATEKSLVVIDEVGKKCRQM